MGNHNFKVGTTSGLYTVGRDPELANAIGKLGYTLTRGTGAMEISSDVAHEVPYSHGLEIRQIAKKQEVDVLLHGDLHIPMCLPERAEWRDAHDRITKSLRSAIFAGANYVDFHASLNIWLELVTYAGRKLTMSFCDHEGNFISKVLKENRKLREWFVEERWDDYLSDVLEREEIDEAQTRARIEANDWRREEEIRRLDEIGIPDEFIELIQTRGAIPMRVEEALPEEQVRRVEETLEEIREETARKNTKLGEQYLQEVMKDKLARGRRWRNEDLRAVVGIIDGYHLITHLLFYTRDPVWKEMVKQYKDVLKGPYKPDYSDDRWLDKAWKRSEEENDRNFKEFFYAVAGAKYLEGHLKAAFQWLENEFIPEEIPKMVEDEDEERKLKEIAQGIIMAIENPDAREPQHAGLYLLWHIKQIYAAVKAIRKTLPDKWARRVWMLVDWEHLANHGRDSLHESRIIRETAPDLGEYTISCHANHPNPMQPHIPLDPGDELLYEILWNLRQTGFGRERAGYLIFERGGGEDPFKQSIEILKFHAQFLERGVPPDELPLEFYGVRGPTAGGFKRQLQIVRDHMWEPMKDLLEMPEEEWTMLSRTAIEKGKKPEQWKRGEFR